MHESALWADPVIFSWGFDTSVARASQTTRLSNACIGSLGRSSLLCIETFLRMSPSCTSSSNLSHGQDLLHANYVVVAFAGTSGIVCVAG
jgi:hypothetical protein